MRIGNGFDAHRFASRSRPLILAGVTIDESPGLEGHSDADVVTHAVIDALLGAAALGDIGERFGVDKPEMAGADSLALLSAVAGDVGDTGQVLVSLDVTVVAERPRLSGFRQQMRERIAGSAGVDPSIVSVKFTTADGMGSIGRGEGIAAWAVCMLAPRPEPRHG